MKASMKSRHASVLFRSGLTLLELVVVVTILAALAAMLVPLFPGLVSQAHSSAASTNEGEVTKLVQMYYTQNSVYPSNLDSLVDTSGTLFQRLPTITMMGSQLVSDLQVATPSTSDIMALQNAGITTVLNMQEGANSTVTNSAWNATLYPYGDGVNGLAVNPSSAAVAIASASLAMLSNSTTSTTSSAVARLGFSPTGAGTYYVFGLGGYSTMQGSMIEDAPVHWMNNMTMNGMTMSMNPDAVYSRFGLVFQTNTGTASLSTARFVGTVLLTGAGVVNATKPMSTFFSTQP